MSKDDKKNSGNNEDDIAKAMASMSGEDADAPKIDVGGENSEIDKAANYEGAPDEVDTSAIDALLGGDVAGGGDGIPTMEPTDPMMPMGEPANMAAAEPTALVSAPTELDAVRSNALIDLLPLLDKVEMTPEETFNMYMLAIQARNDESLVGRAYDAAKAIVDDVKRAQALLTVVREIDYLKSK